MKQETLEEGDEIITTTKFSWQQERSYSEEELFFFIREALYDTDMRYDRISVEEWFEQFKKK
jgi:hypothetical protein